MIPLGTELSRRAAVERVVGLFAVLFLPRDLLAQSREPFPHPDPRPGITADHVLSAEELGSNKSVLESYETARAHPALFDGLYCTCECKESMGHRSLLSCFESRQAAGCWGCREQAELVARMVKKGENLEAIRRAFDVKWG